MKQILETSWLGIVLVLGLSYGARADQFHYNNILLGERAQGLGGAFCAVADDASAIVYNPAGLGFALANDISGSANAFLTKKVTYKKTIGDDDFIEKSRGPVAPFVGALAKLDHLVSGLVWAFGLYSTDSELKDQDDLIESDTLRFHRTANLRANTNKLGFALAKRFGSSFAVGIGINYFMVDELTQEYQDATTLSVNALDDNGEVIVDENGDPDPSYYWQYLNQNIRQYLTASGIEPVLGIQWAMSSKWAFGLTIKKGIILSQSYDINTEVTVSYETLDHSQVVDAVEEGIDNGRSHRAITKDKEKDALEWPMEVRSGVAYFASTSLLVTADVIHHGEAKGGSPLYEREAVLDYAIGTEYYMTASWPVRFGYFTNNDARPEVSSSEINQQDHIDYTGYSLFFATVQPNSQIALGVIHQIGKGQAQKIANSSKVQDVEAQFTTVGFSVAHNF